jgi:hypothetical protein
MNDFDDQLVQRETLGDLEAQISGHGFTLASNFPTSSRLASLCNGSRLKISLLLSTTRGIA